ncbi:hypothetical protein [Tenacibaculum maritimum]|uniref:Uncharacterized protein n=1 Tax=Tenacibaculum maritimum NCIMB 2154 TaxID=1349785 RepID=A0A2H1ECV1_9FLAO|nr:hypothetical protein [Tenacibaculum maritimum]MCD9583340.1 hypothetical protein [Tenacibaculum maritimum]MCD9637351.1 hypothetical protein [Tenacibaculum maritimum]CAA0163808.1 conserved hypothetical protein [Tenacibaculum maritimum]CAA0166097.1 conserved hypothetical protein [Tenacibaculum maritimum]CAA0169794.1 conserved hypothetical protein [Tenacibaculum maritimum]
MNLIEIVGQNHFLTKLYPKGINSLSIASLSSDFSRVYINIRTQDVPSLFIKKYGEWKKDYDTLEFKFIGSLVSFINVCGWDVNNKEECSYDFQLTENGISLKFWKDDKWSIEIGLKVLTFQSCVTYIKEENDYYPH